jgi:hypothetical protein
VKKPVFNEEVRVGKVQDTKRVSDEVRHEELRTETEGDVRKEGHPLKPSMYKKNDSAFYLFRPARTAVA